MNITLHPYKNENLDEAAAFIARLNADPTQHIIYFDTEITGITHYMGEIEPAPEETFLLAMENDRLIGLMGAEYDLELGRSWLHGPFVDHAQWDEVAEKLLGEILANLPDAITDHEIACDKRAARVRSFAEAHGFNPSGESAYLLLGKGQFSSADLDPAPALEERFADAFIALHDSTFPGTYYNGKQMLEKQDEHNRIVAITDNQDLLGYIFATVALETGEAYFDFIGVSENARGRGVGSRLLRTALDWVFSYEPVKEVGLTVSTTNQAAIKLYEKASFKSERILLGFRRKP